MSPHDDLAAHNQVKRILGEIFARIILSVILENDDALDQNQHVPELMAFRGVETPA